MLIQLDRIREQPFRWQETLEIDPAQLDRTELAALGPVEWQGEIVFVDPGFLLRGELKSFQTLTCVRCLGVVEEVVVEPVDRLILTHSVRPVSELELQEEDMNVVHLSGEELNTEPIVVEQLQLIIPMKPLCRPDCGGLCPECGNNRNEASCRCSEETVDPRWSALVALRNQLGDD